MDRMQVYLVGGAVRDKHLGLPVQDRDWVVVGATPQDMEAQGYVRVGKDFLNKVPYNNITRYLPVNEFRKSFSKATEIMCSPRLELKIVKANSCVVRLFSR